MALAERAARRVEKTRIFDAIYTRNLPVVLAMSVRARLPIVYETYRPWPDLDATKRLLFRALARRDRLAGIVLTSHQLVTSYERAGFSPQRLLVAHNGIDWRRFAEPIDKDEARDRLGLPRRSLLAVHVGQIGPSAGLELVLEAARLLPELSFALVGAVGSSPVEARVRPLSNVRLVPWQTPGMVATWLMAADILVVPPTASPLEPLGSMLPQKAFQYLASGRAIIGPDTPALREVLTDGFDARLVPPDRLESFASALAALARDPGLRAALGNRARASAEAKTWEDRAGRILDFMVSRGITAAARHRVIQRGPRPVA
jgi:glycosyltransferase involved in cell wall biosynthesis